MDKDVIIIGGGASGLVACAALARERKSMQIALVEKLDRVGKKLLSTGNGRCNLSNEDMNPQHYAQAGAFVSKVYATTPADQVSAFFSSLGLMTVCEEGRIYPRTMAASSVLDVLRGGVDRPNVSILTQHEAMGLEPITEDELEGWRVSFADGTALTAHCVIFSAGGCAAPSAGTDGKSFDLLRRLGLRVSPLYPALVQLRCDHRALKSLKGIRIQARISLQTGDQIAAEETGELLFADYGVSGVCVFQLSRYVESALDQHLDTHLNIDFLPEIDQKDLMDWLEERIRIHKENTAENLFTGVLQRMLALAVLREAEISPDCACKRLSKKQKERLIRAISDFTLPVTGTQGFKQAQVTRGGVELSQINPCSMAVNGLNGLYITGEALDVDGPCGGYNLHFAFASALTAVHGILTEYLIF